MARIILGALRGTNALILVVLFLSSLPYAGAGEVYSPGQCGYQVTFPARPRLRSVFVFGVQGEEAIYSRSAPTIALRAACVPYHVYDRAQFTAALPGALEQMASLAGLTAVSVTVEDTKLGLQGKIIGYKQADGATMRLTSVCLVGFDSLLQVWIVEDSQAPLSKEAIAFGASLAIKGGAQ